MRIGVAIGATGRALSLGFAAFYRSLSFSEKMFWLFLLSISGYFVFIVIDYTHDSTSPSDRMARAQAACEGTFGHCFDPLDAIDELAKIPSSAPEYAEASKLITLMRQQVDAKTKEQSQTPNEAQIASWQKTQANFNGSSHDEFICSTSTEKQSIVSFDNGRFWWKDEDNRCAEREQKHRDEAAAPFSYWPTTVRVDTDMDSGWLPDEERTCMTSPNEKGRVTSVSCDPNSHSPHNIPVQFFGGIDRNTVSEWRCRREKNLLSDQFVCRAVN
jgi:hypothetical protein